MSYLFGYLKFHYLNHLQNRFEDLRSVAHSLYEGDRRYIPEKPLKVNRNFRSHAGILSVAAAVLERLFAAFPTSTHRLAPDQGVFLGPRPGVLKEVDMDGLRSLLLRNPRLMVLMHDEKVSELKERLNITHPIIGIRDSKGNYLSGFPRSALALSC